MSGFDFAASLDRWREQEEHEAALQLLLDRPLLGYAGLWRQDVVRRVLDWPMDESWPALWECVHVNHALLADLADDTEARARHQVMRLRSLRLIYPDGTVTAMTKKAIGKLIAENLN